MKCYISDFLHNNLQEKSDTSAPEQVPAAGDDTAGVRPVSVQVLYRNTLQKAIYLIS